MFRVNNRNTRTRCEICSNLTIKTPEWRQWRRSGVFIVNFEDILHLVLVFLLLTFWASKCRLVKSPPHMVISKQVERRYTKFCGISKKSLLFDKSICFSKCRTGQINATRNKRLFERPQKIFDKILQLFFSFWIVLKQMIEKVTQPAFTCSNSIIEIPEQ